MLNKKESHCLLCGAGKYDVIFTYDAPDKYEEALGIEKRRYFRQWARCSNCGFCYSIYSRAVGAMDKIYTEKYRSTASLWRTETPLETFERIIALPLSESETKQRVMWLKERLAEAKRDSLGPSCSPPHDFLDVGGGAAIFAYEFMDSNWRAHIVDPAENLNLAQKLHIPFKQDFYTQGLFGKRFCLLSMIYVLEHVLDPLSFLKTAFSDLKRHSYLFIEVPDSIAFRLKPKDDDIFNSCHLWMFNPETLAVILFRCGFETLHLRRLKTLRDHYAVMALAVKRDK